MAAAVVAATAVAAVVVTAVVGLGASVVLTTAPAVVVACSPVGAVDVPHPARRTSPRTTIDTHRIKDGNEKRLLK